VPTSKLLLIGRDPTVIEPLREVVNGVSGLELRIYDDPGEVESLARWEGVALILVVLARRGDDSRVARLLRSIAEHGRSVATLILGDPDQADRARALLRLGAADFLCRPLERTRLAYLVEVLTIRAWHTQSPLPPGGEPGSLALRLAGSPGPERGEPLFLHTSPETRRLEEQIRRVAPRDATILLGGETGTGKTRMARQIHERSGRRDEPFLVINCGALSSALVESEMFGHVRGAFTGADRDRVGKFAEVGGGTLLLDEVDTLPPEIQAKLLRAVEERTFEPVGSNRSMPVRARLIAAANRPLDLAVADGLFRSDLYYRLNVVGFQLPPLRDRRAAIAPLAERFVEEFSKRDDQPIRGISEAALRVMSAHDWPGNIRELRNVVERAVALCDDDEIQLGDLPDSVLQAGPWPHDPTGEADRSHAGQADTTLARIKDQAECARISRALEQNNNNRARAASELGISRMTLYKKLYKHGFMAYPAVSAAREGGAA